MGLLRPITRGLWSQKYHRNFLENNIREPSINTSRRFIGRSFGLYRKKYKMLNILVLCTHIYMRGWGLFSLMGFPQSRYTLYTLEQTHAQKTPEWWIEVVSCFVPNTHTNRIYSRAYSTLDLEAIKPSQTSQTRDHYSCGQQQYSSGHGPETTHGLSFEADT